MGKKDQLAKVAGTIATVAVKKQLPFLGTFLDSGKVGEAVEKLVDRGFLRNLNIEGLAKMDAKELASSETLKDVENEFAKAIERVRKESAGALVENALSDQMFNWLLTAVRCNGKLGPANATNAEKLPKGAKDLPAFEYQYNIDELPKASFDTEAALKRCFLRWMRVCGAIFTETHDREAANVIVKLDDIDGRGNILADAHLGPVGNFQLELRIDKSEVWDEQKFEAAIGHEIGHLLGLEHSNTPGQLMNTTVGAIIEPKSEDIEFAQGRWGDTRFEPARETRRQRGSLK